MNHPITHAIFGKLWRALAGEPEWQGRVSFSGEGTLPSPFAVTDFAAATFAAAGCAIGELLSAAGHAAPDVAVDRVLASGWFHLPDTSKRVRSPEPHSVDWTWLTEFPTADGRFLRAQAIFPTLRSRITNTLGTGDDAAAVADVIRRHDGDEIEQILVDAGACVAVNRSVKEWLAHSAGAAIRSEALIDRDDHPATSVRDWAPTPGRPLAGIKVLDLTRVIAGPNATKFLAGMGAEVLRLDRPGSDETSGRFGKGSEHMIGKRWAFLDLREEEGRARFLDLLAQADILVHGYRPGGIDALIDPEMRRQVKPDLVEVAYRAYGWAGPWAIRRGFDTLVQWSSGMADETQSWGLANPALRVPLTVIGRPMDASRPRHMPVEALDFGTAYLVAAAAVRGLTQRLRHGQGSTSRLSLARTGMVLINEDRMPDSPPIALPLEGPWEDRIFVGAKGPLQRLQSPLNVSGNPLFWERPSEPAGSSTPIWAS